MLFFQLIALGLYQVEQQVDCVPVVRTLTVLRADVQVSKLLAVAQFSLVRLGIHPDSELSISLVDEDEMSALHMRWMDEPGATDVLSFPMDEVKPHSASSGPGMIGDIVLCPSYAARQANEAGHSIQEELELLTVHGLLHLLGFDHREADEKKVMFDLQAECLSDWRGKR